MGGWDLRKDGFTSFYFPPFITLSDLSNPSAASSEFHNGKEWIKNNPENRHPAPSFPQTLFNASSFIRRVKVFFGIPSPLVSSCLGREVALTRHYTNLDFHGPGDLKPFFHLRKIPSSFFLCLVRPLITPFYNFFVDFYRLCQHRNQHRGGCFW